MACLGSLGVGWIAGTAVPIRHRRGGAFDESIEEPRAIITLDVSFRAASLLSFISGPRPTRRNRSFSAFTAAVHGMHVGGSCCYAP